MKNVIFDLDGTLLDTLPDLMDCVNRSLRAFSLPERTKEQIKASLGNGSAHLIRTSLPGHEAMTEKVLAYYKTIYPPKEGANTAPYPGIPALIEKLSGAGWRLGILSNKPHGAVLSLRDEFFPAIAHAAGDREGTPRKPDPTGLFALMREMGAKPEETVYVGDSEVDVALAKNASLPCAAAAWGYRDEAQLREAGAEVIVRDAKALYEALADIIGNEK